uniref:Uncharacterized protein n=1 Tax=Denticeps clupeoides TaxID=299321 RepID=A0AAY3ZW74_9TELE
IENKDLLELFDFDCGVIVGARQAGLSISETADLLRLSRTTISRVYREWYEKGKTSSERQFCGQKCLVDARGQRRMADGLQQQKTTPAEATGRAGSSKLDNRRFGKWFSISAVTFS